MKTVTLLSFSHRAAGNCAAVAAYIRQQLSDCHILEFVMDAESCQPCHDCDYQCLKGEGACPHQKGNYYEVLQAICASDLTYFILPNYCGFPCASYFAFNERSVGFFHGNETVLARYLDTPKRFVIVSNTESQVFVEAMQQQVSQEPQILYLKSKNYGKQSINGDILTSTQAQIDLANFLRRDFPNCVHYTTELRPTQQN